MVKLRDRSRRRLFGPRRHYPATARPADPRAGKSRRCRSPSGTGHIAAALFGFGLVAAACGGSSGSSRVANLGKQTSTSTSLLIAPAATGVAQSEVLAFVSCIRSHGVPGFPDPLPNGGFARSALQAVDQSSLQFKGALQACRALAIATGFEHTPAQIEQHVEQETAEDACIRKHGVPNMPDPNAQGEQSFPQAITPSSPQFQAAQKACAYLNP